MKKISSTLAVREDWDKVKSWNYKNEDTSVVYAELEGDHGWVKTQDRKRYYYIVEGSGFFETSAERVRVNSGDVLVLEPNTRYNYHPISSKLKVLLFMELWDN